MRDWQRLEEKFRNHLEGEWYGEIVSFFKGTGIEIADSRQYQPGDHSKHINRKLSAKHDKLYVNTYQSELAPHVEIFLDINQNRLAGERTRVSQQVVELLADYQLVTERWQTRTTLRWKHHDRWHNTHLSTRPDWAIWLPELLSIVKQTVRYQSGYRTALPAFVDMLLRKRYQQRVVFLISDFLGDPDLIEKKLRTLAAHHVPATVKLPIPRLVGRGFDKVSYRPAEELVLTPTIVL